MANYGVNTELGGSKKRQKGRVAQVKLEAPKGKLPASVCIEIAGGSTMVLIPKGSKLPQKYSQVFSTVEPFQQEVNIRLVYGDRPMSKDCIGLVRMRVSNIAWKKAGEPKISMDVHIDKHGELTLMTENLERKSSDGNYSYILEAAQVPASYVRSVQADDDQHVETDQANAALIAEYDSIRRYHHQLFEMYQDAKNEMTFMERHRYRHVKNIMIDALSTPESRATEKDLEAVRAALEKLKEQEPLLRERQERALKKAR